VATATARKRPKPPAKLAMKTALAYSAALSQLDAGQKDKAREMLADVVKQQPDFQLAAADLDKLMQ
jgi:predicted Zn-dependent protease